MMKNTKGKGKGHGHPWIVGIAGIIVAVMIYIHLPMLKVVSGAVLLFSLAHLVIAGVVLISAYLISPQKLKYILFEKERCARWKGNITSAGPSAG